MNVEQVLAHLVSRIESSSVLPWHKPWGSAGIPVNACTGSQYNGINILVLLVAAIDGNYTSNSWLTFKQAQSLGLGVRKGEHSPASVLFSGRGFVCDCGAKCSPPETCPKRRAWSKLKSWPVFNASQVDGLVVESVKSSSGSNAAADSLLVVSGARVAEGKPCYIPSRNVICLPRICDFETMGDYYSTMFHELTHWLVKDHGTQGSLEYAEGELVAELSSAFLCAEFGIAGSQAQWENSASYLDSWLKSAKKEPRYLLRVSNKARKVAEFLGLLLEGEAGPDSVQDEWEKKHGKKDSEKVHVEQAADGQGDE